MRAASLDSFPHLRQKPAVGRWLFALALSALVHGWLAWELPAGSLRTGAGYPALEVRISPREAPGPDDGDTNAMLTSARDVRLSAPPIDPPARKPATRGPVAARPPDAQRSADGTAASAAVAPSADTTYYPARELDVYPAPLTPLAVPYPERALQDSKGGHALVMLLIDAYGKVDEIAVVETEPAGYFEAAAVKTFEDARFSAGRREGVPVRSRVLIRLDFDPTERAAAAR